jgi:hypothetical protein
VVYIGGVALLYYHIREWLIFTSLIFLVNGVCLYFTGNYLLRGILFPYANPFIRRQLDSAINKRFSTEFTRLIVLMSHMVKILAGIEPIESYHIVKEDLNNSWYENTERGTTSKTSEEIEKVDIMKTTFEINQKMTAVLDLVGMYWEINTEIITKRLDENGSSKYFKRATT